MSGTTFRLTLSEPASLRIALQRKLPGRRAAGRGGRCVPPSRANRGGRSCTRWVAAGALTRTGLAAGPQRIGFDGRVGRRALRAGAYRATLVATDPAGNRSLPRALAFTVVRAAASR